MSALYYLTIAEASRRIRSGELSPVVLAEACLDRIANLDSTLSSFILVTPESALNASRAAEAEIAAGNWRGPLHGIPVAYKDIYSTAGVPTTCHSRLLLENIPAEDAVTVAKLTAAGAISLGKLATHEFAFGGPSFDLPFPPARNPWNTEHVPGGSSSGSGVAVAAGLCAGAMGSDTGGSIRAPSGLNGIAGIKPSYGLLSRRGIYPLSWTLDHAGPMCRTVEDCALMLQALAGYDAADPASVEVAIPDYAAESARPVKGLRVGVVRDWFDGTWKAAAPQAAAIDVALETIRGLGAEVREVVLPDLADFHAAGRIILLSEAWAIHRRHVIATPQAYGQFFRDRVRLGAFISASQYLDAQRMRRDLTARTLAAMADVDVLVTANQYAGAEKFESATATYPFFSKPYLTMPFNVTGMPALTVRCGFDAHGLPLALQIAGRPFDDATVLRLGHAYEEARGGWDREPPL